MVNNFHFWVVYPLNWRTFRKQKTRLLTPPKSSSWGLIKNSNIQALKLPFKKLVFLKKIERNLETWSKNKNTNPFGQPQENKMLLAAGKGPLQWFSGRELSLDWLEKGSQWGEIPEVMWLEEQSSEVLYDTYHHGLPFNQRVERKDKVKLSSPFSFNYSHEQEI